MEVSFPWLSGRAEILHFSSSKILILLPFHGILLPATFKWSQSRNEWASFILMVEGWLKPDKMSLFFNFFHVEGWKSAITSPGKELCGGRLRKEEQRKSSATLAIGWQNNLKKTHKKNQTSKIWVQVQGLPRLIAAGITTDSVSVKGNWG